jgi:hypothetical protein
MKTHAYHHSALVVLAAISAEARQWQDIISHEIYSQPNIDSDRYQLKIELDPFFYPDENPVEMAPSPQPHTHVLVTASPTMVPSSIPSDFPSLAPSGQTGPTASPTTRAQNVDGNGGCHEGTVLVQVNMYDSWGDGWDSTLLKITGIEDQDTTNISGNTVTKTQTTNTGDTTVSISNTIELTSAHPFGTGTQEAAHLDPLGMVFDGGLLRGSHSAVEVCLMPRRCYEVVVQGGENLDEVSWDIRSVILGSDEQAPDSLIQGGAPVDCTFSLPDENGESFCPSTCSSTMNPQLTQVPQIFDQLSLVEEEEAEEGTLVAATRNFNDTDASNNGQHLLNYIRNGNGNNGQHGLDALRNGNGNRQ